MKLFILLLICCTLFIVLPLCGQTQSDNLQVTYIANEGFFLQSPHHKILIDALFSDGYGPFATPPKGIIDQMMDAKSPFDGVELCFLTHYHKDHCDSKLIQDYLKKYPAVTLVTTKPSLVFIDGEQFGFVQLKKQFCEMTPGINQSLSQTIGTVPVKSLGIKHMSFYRNGIDLEEYMFNVGYWFDMDGFKIFHSGDCMLNNLRDYIAKNGTWADSIDVAFLCCNLLDDGASGLDYMMKTLKPKNIVLMHIPPKTYQEWSVKAEQLKSIFPNIFLFKESMDSKTIPSSVGLH